MSCALEGLYSATLCLNIGTGPGVMHQVQVCDWSSGPAGVHTSDGCLFGSVGAG